jgi:putative ABC transport system permease protein
VEVHVFEGADELIVLLDDAFGPEPFGEASAVALEEPTPLPALEPEPTPDRGELASWSLVFDLASANLFASPSKLLASLAGVVFAAYLMSVQVGLLLGFVDTTTALIARSPGDVWLVPKGTVNFEMVDPQPGATYHHVMGTPGVSWGSRVLAGWSDWQTASGERERVFVVGVDPERPVCLPWAMQEGSVDGLFEHQAVVVDGLDRETLGGGQAVALGHDLELGGHRSRVVGISRDVRSFTTFPYVFTNQAHARDVVFGLRDPARDLHYVVVGLEAGADVEAVCQELERRLPDSEALTTEAFVGRTAHYWLVNTGVGAMNVLAAILGLLVGGAIVAQTTHARTMELLKEYGTLKALGATDRELAGVVLLQALATGAAGFLLGLLLAVATAGVVNQGRLLILFGTASVICLALLTLLMCAGAAVLSIRGVVRLEPAIAFRG